VGSDFLFPRRLAHRDFLKWGGAAAAGWLAPFGATRAEDHAEPVRIGSGNHTYEAVPEWGCLPAGMKYGFGCGVIVDSEDRVCATSRSTNPCVATFDPQGQLLEARSNDFGAKIGLSTAQVADTAHCLYWSKEGADEFIYWTENISTNKKAPNSALAFTRPICKAKSFTRSAMSKKREGPHKSLIGRILRTWRCPATETFTWWMVTAVSG
jgi:hypothetical protein